MNNEFVYPKNSTCFAFYCVPTLFICGWLIAFMFPDQILDWIDEHYGEYYLKYWFNIISWALKIWFLWLAYWLISFGTKSIVSKRSPPNNFAVWYKMKIVSGNEAKQAGAFTIISGILVILFVVFMIYGDYISYSTDI